MTARSFDRHGNRLWGDAHALLDSEHARYAVGDVAVPYGRCTEPSNVKAGGGACPVRFRCAGCDHFRTDVSHLPELTAYLDDLLRTTFPWEEYVLARSLVAAGAEPETDLFAGVRAPIEVAQGAEVRG